MTYTYIPTTGIRADELKMGNKFFDNDEKLVTVKSVRIIRAKLTGPDQVTVSLFNGDIFLFHGNAEVQILI